MMNNLSNSEFLEDLDEHGIGYDYIHEAARRLRVLIDEMNSAEQTLRNLGSGWLQGDAKEIAHNASFRIEYIARVGSNPR